MFFVRIDQAGWEAFSDQLGGVEFKDGVSVRPVTDAEANRLGASLKLVRVEDDEQVGIASTIVNALALQSEAPIATIVAPEVVPAKPVATTLRYDRDALEAIAEKDGIKGVRKIADEFGVKGVQITALIDGILDAQGEDV